MKTIEEMFYELFVTAFDFMFFSSGDGISVIVSDDYLQIADLFEEWANDHYPKYFTKVISDEHCSVVFNGTDTEEGIIFMKYLEPNCHNMYEFVAVLPNWYQLDKE